MKESAARLKDKALGRRGFLGEAGADPPGITLGNGAAERRRRRACLPVGAVLHERTYAACPVRGWEAGWKEKGRAAAAPVQACPPQAGPGRCCGTAAGAGQRAPYSSEPQLLQVALPPCVWIRLEPQRLQVSRPLIMLDGLVRRYSS